VLVIDKGNELIDEGDLYLFKVRRLFFVNEGVDVASSFSKERIKFVLDSIVSPVYLFGVPSRQSS